jgi:hypothetical protein
VADNSTQGGADTIRDKDRAGVKTQIFGLDVGIGTGTEALMSAANPMPVNISGSAGNGAQVTQTLTAAGLATLAGTGSTTGSAVVDVSNAGNISFHLLAAGFVGTVVFEQSFDPAGANGTWALVPVIPEDATTPSMTTLAINTAVAYVRQFTQGMFGPRLFRVRVSAFTSGSLTFLGSAGPGWVEGQPALAPSSAVIGAVSLAAAATPTGATVNTSGTANTNSVLLAADANRKALMVWNAGTGVLSVGFGFTTTTTLYSARIQPGQGYEVPPQFAPFALNGMSTVATQPVNITSAV